MKNSAHSTFCCAIGGLLLAASTAHASDAGAGAGAASGLLQMIMSLLIVLAIIAAIAWGIKRMGGMRGNSNAAVQIIGAGSVGPRERVVLVEVAGKWLVLGVAQGSVNLLATLAPQERPPQTTEFATAGLTPKFADWLQRALAARKER